MAKKHNILFYQSEIKCEYQKTSGSAKKSIATVSLRYNDIQNVSIKPCTERKGLKVRPSERIFIRAPKLARPIEYYKFKEEPFFDDYKNGLRLFCKKNKVKIIDEVID